MCRLHRAVDHSKNFKVHPAEGRACGGFRAEEQHDLTRFSNDPSGCCTEVRLKGKGQRGDLLGRYCNILRVPWTRVEAMAKFSICHESTINSICHHIGY